MPEVIVAGAGVVGLTAAIRLREAGIAADVVARDPPAATTSAVAAALWYPYRAFPRERVAAWSARGFAVLSGLAATPGSGVRMRWGTELVAPGAEDPWWRPAVPSFARTAEGYRFAAPVADMSVHLPWLVARLEALGGSLAIATLGDDEFEPGGGDRLAHADRRVARPQSRRLDDGSRRRGSGRHAVHVHAARQSFELRVGGNAFHLDPIGLFQLVLGMRDARLQRAIRGQHHQAFAVGIQPPGGVDVRHVDKLLQRRARAVAGELAQHAIRLVEEDHARD